MYPYGTDINDVWLLANVKLTLKSKDEPMIVCYLGYDQTIKLPVLFTCKLNKWDWTDIVLKRMRVVCSDLLY